MTVKCIVFDFDGTIADSYKEVKRVVNIERKSIKTGGEFDKVKKKGFRGIIEELKIPFWMLPGVRYLILRKLEPSNFAVFQGIEEELRLLSGKYDIGIVSSNSGRNIRSFLVDNRIEDLFSFIYSGSFLFGKHRILKRICRERRLDPQELVYIGDEDRDVMAAKKAGVISVAVSWGYNNKGRLTECCPDILMNHPEELRDHSF
ncbi:MAG: HAD-IA family hydrolase [Patescibacteria group bacterium]